MEMSVSRPKRKAKTKPKELPELEPAISLVSSELEPPAGSVPIFSDQCLPVNSTSTIDPPLADSSALPEGVRPSAPPISEPLSSAPQSNDTVKALESILPNHSDSAPAAEVARLGSRTRTQEPVLPGPYASLLAQAVELHARESTVIPLCPQPFTRSQLRCLCQNATLFETLDEQLEAFVQTRAQWRSQARHPFADLLARLARTWSVLCDARERLDAAFSRLVALSDTELARPPVAPPGADPSHLVLPLWRRETRTVNVEAPCADGVKVRKTLSFEVAVFDEAVASAIDAQQSDVRAQLYAPYLTAAYECAHARLSAELYLERLFERSPTLAAVPPSADVALANPVATAADVPLQQELACFIEHIDVAFAFLRKLASDRSQSRNGTATGSGSPAKSAGATSKSDSRTTSPSASAASGSKADSAARVVREWLLRLCAPVLRVGSTAEHTAILLQLLHTPHGWARDWAAELLQPRLSDLPPLAPTSTSAPTADVGDTRPLNHASEFVALALGLLMRPLPGRSTVLPSESQNRRASASDSSRAAQPSAALEADEAASLDDEFMCTDRAAFLEKIARSAAAPGARSLAVVPEDASSSGGCWDIVDMDEVASLIAQPQQRLAATPPDALAESDLLALLAQLPLRKLIRRLVALRVSRSSEVYEPWGQSEYAFRRTIAFVRLCILEHVRVGIERYADPARGGSYTRLCVQLAKFVLRMCRSLCEHWSLYRAAMLDLIARDANPSAPPHPATVTDSPSAPPLAPADATTPNTGANLERLEQLQLEMDEMLLDCARIFVSCANITSWKYLSKLPFYTLSGHSNGAVLSELLAIGDQVEEVIPPEDSASATASATATAEEGADNDSSGFRGALVALVSRSGPLLDVNVEFFFDALRVLLLSRLRCDSCERRLAATCGDSQRVFHDSVEFVETAVVQLFEAVYYLNGSRSKIVPSHMAILSRHLISTLVMLCRSPVHSQFIFNSIFDSLYSNFDNDCEDATPSERQVELVRELCTSVPWALWRPSESQLTRIERWMLEFGLTSSRSAIARIVLERLSFERADDLHLRLCLLVLRASEHLLATLWEKPAAADGSSSTVTKGAKGAVAVPSMLNIAYSMGSNITNEALSSLISFLQAQVPSRAGEASHTRALEELAQYLWRVALRLKLDAALDVGDSEREGERRQLLADVEDLVERAPQSRNPFLAFFCVLLPKASRDGISEHLRSMSKLVESYCHLPAIRCVEYLSLRAIRSYQSASETSPATFRQALFENPLFCSIIGSILHADQEYWSYYKKWLKFQQEQTFPGPVLTIFSEMISAQVSGISAAERSQALEFWVRTLLAVNGAPAVSSSAGGSTGATANAGESISSGAAAAATGDGTGTGSSAGVPQWWASRAALYALEMLARAAFHAGLDHVFLDLLYPEYRALILRFQSVCQSGAQGKQRQSTSANPLSFLSFAFGSKQSPLDAGVPNWLDGFSRVDNLGTYTQKPEEIFAFLSRLMILVHERYEDESQLWAAFVSELGRRAAVQHSSIDAEAALEQALAQSSLHQLTLGRSGRARRLALYEWRDLARALCPSHPLAALVWLHFFLRLFRVAPGYGFNLLENASTLPDESPKKLSQNLEQLLQCSESASSNQSTGSESSSIRRRFVRAAHLWAQEQILHTLRRPEEVARLPDQYSPELFAAVVRASAQPSDWELVRGLVSTQGVSNELRGRVRRWCTLTSSLQSHPMLEAEAQSVAEVAGRTPCCLPLSPTLWQTRLLHRLASGARSAGSKPLDQLVPLLPPPEIHVTQTGGSGKEKEDKGRQGLVFGSDDRDALASLFEAVVRSRNAVFLTQLLERKLDAILRQAHLHEYLRTTHRSNDSNFLEKVAKLYSNDQQITKVSLSCAEAALFASIRNVRCCGPVIVNVSINEVRLQEQVQLILRDIAAKNENFMDILFQQSAIAMGRERPISSATVALVADFSVKQLALSILFIENLIEWLSDFYSIAWRSPCPDQSTIDFVSSLGVDLFYRLAARLVEDNTGVCGGNSSSTSSLSLLENFAPALGCVQSAIETLGRTFVATSPAQASTLLSFLERVTAATAASTSARGQQSHPQQHPSSRSSSAARSPAAHQQSGRQRLLELLSPYFFSAPDSPYFARIYAHLMRFEPSADLFDSEHLFSFLSKIELTKWLSYSPSEDDRIATLDMALMALNRDSSRTNALSFGIYERHVKVLIESLCKPESAVRLLLCLLAHSGGRASSMPLAYMHEVLRRQCTLPATSLVSSSSSGSTLVLQPPPPAPHELELLTFSSDKLHALADAVYAHLFEARRRSLGNFPLLLDSQLLTQLQRNDFLEHVAAIAPNLLLFLRFIIQQLWIKAQDSVRNGADSLEAAAQNWWVIVFKAFCPLVEPIELFFPRVAAGSDGQPVPPSHGVCRPNCEGDAPQMDAFYHLPIYWMSTRITNASTASGTTQAAVSSENASQQTSASGAFLVYVLALQTLRGVTEDALKLADSSANARAALLHGLWVYYCNTLNFHLHAAVARVESSSPSKDSLALTVSSACLMLQCVHDNLLRPLPWATALAIDERLLHSLLMLHELWRPMLALALEPADSADASKSSATATTGTAAAPSRASGASLAAQQPNQNASLGSIVHEFLVRFLAALNWPQLAASIFPNAPDRPTDSALLQRALWLFIHFADSNHANFTEFRVSIQTFKKSVPSIAFRVLPLEVYDAMLNSFFPRITLPGLLDSDSTTRVLYDLLRSLSGFMYLNDLSLVRDAGQTAAAEPEPAELHKCVSFLRQSTRFLETLPSTQCAVAALSAALAPAEERTSTRRRAESRSPPSVPSSAQLVHLIYDLFLDARSCLPTIEWDELWMPQSQLRLSPEQPLSNAPIEWVQQVVSLLVEFVAAWEPFAMGLSLQPRALSPLLRALADIALHAAHRSLLVALVSECALTLARASHGSKAYACLSRVLLPLIEAAITGYFSAFGGSDCRVLDRMVYHLQPLLSANCSSSSAQIHFSPSSGNVTFTPSRPRSPSGGLTRQSTLPAEDAFRRLDRNLPAVLSDCVEVSALLTLHCLVCALRRAHVDPLVAGSSASFADLLACPRKSSTASCGSAVTTGTATATGAPDVRQRRDSNQEKRHLLPSAAEPSAPVVRYTCSFKQFLELCLLIKLTSEEDERKFVVLVYALLGMTLQNIRARLGISDAKQTAIDSSSPSSRASAEASTGSSALYPSVRLSPTPADSGSLANVSSSAELIEQVSRLALLLIGLAERGSLGGDRPDPTAGPSPSLLGSMISSISNLFGRDSKEYNVSFKLRYWAGGLGAFLFAQLPGDRQLRLSVETPGTPELARLTGGGTPAGQSATPQLTPSDRCLSSLAYLRRAREELDRVSSSSNATADTDERLLLVAGLVESVQNACNRELCALHAEQVAARLLDAFELRRAAPFLSHLNAITNSL